MSDFDPTTDVLNNAINQEGWTILDVRNDEELVRDGNLRDHGIGCFQVRSLFHNSQPKQGTETVVRRKKDISKKQLMTSGNLKRACY